MKPGKLILRAFLFTPQVEFYWIDISAAAARADAKSSEKAGFLKFNLTLARLLH